jgi:four helix bundle protein
LAIGLPAGARRAAPVRPSCGRQPRLGRDGDRRRHYEIAAGSAREVTVALRIAVANRYITAAERATVEEPLDRVRAMLYRLVR